MKTHRKLPFILTFIVAAFLAFPFIGHAQNSGAMNQSGSEVTPTPEPSPNPEPTPDPEPTPEPEPTPDPDSNGDEGNGNDGAGRPTPDRPGRPEVSEHVAAFQEAHLALREAFTVKMSQEGLTDEEKAALRREYLAGLAELRKQFADEFPAGARRLLREGNDRPNVPVPPRLRELREQVRAHQAETAAQREQLREDLKDAAPEERRAAMEAFREANAERRAALREERREIREEIREERRNRRNGNGD